MPYAHAWVDPLRAPVPHSLGLHCFPHRTTSDYTIAPASTHSASRLFLRLVNDAPAEGRLFIGVASCPSEYGSHFHRTYKHDGRRNCRLPQ